MELYQDSEKLKSYIQENLENKYLRLNVSPHIGEDGLKRMREIMDQMEFDEFSLISWEQNDWKSEGFKMFAEFFSGLTHLKKFYLLIYESNLLKPDGAAFLSKAITTLVNVKYFSLQIYDNPLGDRGLELFMQAIAQLEELEEVDLVFDQIKANEQGFEEIFKQLQLIKKLKTLQISIDEESCDKCINVYSSGLKLLPNLTKLQIQIKSKSLEHSKLLFDGVASLKNLTYLLFEAQYEGDATDLDISVISLLGQLPKLDTFFLYVYSYQTKLQSQKLSILNHITNSKIINFKINYGDTDKQNTQIIRKSKKIPKLVLLNFYE